ncbi:MAG TPA: branched-chain amino acid ABC transporter permease [Syntrophorhabdales bacterium]|nr:branched-chain amino acid ABC transporter permease [Syntrophorhabdales bacterium]
MLDIFIFWITLSLNYVLLATGLTLTISVMRVVNMAHGNFYMAGAYAFLVFSEKAHMPYGIALLLAILFVGAIGMVVEAKLYRRLGGRIEPSIICMCGVLLALEGLATILFGPDIRGLPPMVAGTAMIGKTVVSMGRLAVAVTALCVITALFIFLKYTRMGKSIRATAQDREAASLMGINVKLVSSLSMGIGTAMAVIAGVQITAVYSLSPFVGITALCTSILIITLGGMGSIIGAFIAAFIIGLSDSFGASFIGRYHHLLSFGTVMLILLFRPLGLMGTRVEAEGKEK